GPGRSPGLDELPARVEDREAVVARVDDPEISVWVDGDIGWAHQPVAGTRSASNLPDELDQADCRVASADGVDAASVGPDKHRAIGDRGAKYDLSVDREAPALDPERRVDGIDVA